MRAARAATLAAAVFGLASAAMSAYRQYETSDEPDHLAYARRLLDTGETERSSQLHFNSKTPASVPNVLARQAARRLGVRGDRPLRFFSRLPTVMEYALLLGTVFVVGRRFLGETAACLATAACALDPNLVANSAVATVDTPYALATLLTLGAVLWLGERVTLARALALGAALGLAFAVKFTAFLLLPGVLVVPWLVPALRARLVSRRLPAAAITAALAALVVVAAAYRFHDVGVELNDVGWRWPAMARLAARVPHLRLPVPADFATGFDVLAVAVDKDYPVVLLGRHFPRGVWYYFAVAWALKTPVLLLAATLFGLARAAAAPGLRSHPAVVLLAANLALTLAYFSFLFTAQVGLRFVLMCVPLAALVAAAGLAPLVQTPRARRWLAVVALTAVAENALYVGNHLAFTSAAVWPKREVFRLLTNANVDWGQNDDKIAGWLEEAGLSAAPFDPLHALAGDNVFELNHLAGVGKFRQHQWLREHASPRAHFGHTHLWFRLDAATDGAPAVFPELGRTDGIVLCLTAPTRLDLGLFGDEGTIVLGAADQPLRDQPLVRPGQQSWYRLDRGTSALAAFWATGFRGRWRVRGGEATLATRRVAVQRGTVEAE
ncbi:MAG: hypothetical protein DMF78_07260 [Acidobacteria bacterium]|nr:MAG: hypothetical protein DMF78_07260 [Acidobacteriota bacterium]